MKSTTTETPSTTSTNKPFWETKTLAEMNKTEWESLCDGCGLCCLTKLQDEDTDEIVYTRVVCRYSDPKTAACSDYENRSTNVPTCVALTLERVAEFDWLPDTCTYRILHRGDPLPDWHPLISGKSDSVQAANIGLLAIPVVVDQEGLDYEDFIIDSL